LKVRFSDFRTITRSTTLPRPTNVTQEIWQVAKEMLSTRLPPKHPPVRLLGVGVSGFQNSSPIQRSLFDDEDHVVQAGLDQAADQIREKFGSASLARASGLLHHAKHTPAPKPRDQAPDP
jgi:DNA polymerase-4